MFKKIKQFKKPSIVKNCLICKKEFKTRYYRKDDAMFCSRRCHNKSMKGQQSWNKGLTKKTDKRINYFRPTVFKKGEHIGLETEFKKGENHKQWKGGKPKCLKCGKETKAYKSKKCGKCERKDGGYFLGKHFKGEKSWNWKGGITPEHIKIRNSIDFRLWREAVLARDNWTCQKTGVKGIKLCCHHIKNFAEYPELRFAIDNGITLSEKSHKEFHSKYGIKNNTLEQIKQYVEKN